jgi:hypothetical protein
MTEQINKELIANQEKLRWFSFALKTEAGLLQTIWPNKTNREIFGNYLTGAFDRFSFNELKDFISSEIKSNKSIKSENLNKIFKTGLINQLIDAESGNGYIAKTVKYLGLSSTPEKIDYLGKILEPIIKSDEYSNSKIENKFENTINLANGLYNKEAKSDSNGIEEIKNDIYAHLRGERSLARSVILTKDIFKENQIS